MGARAQIKVVDEDDKAVYLYTHWGAEGLPSLLAGVLAQNERHGDVEYLTRMIFCAMVRDDIDGTLGYGIGTAEHWDLDYEPIVVMPGDNGGHVIVNGDLYSFAEFVAAVAAGKVDPYDHDEDEEN